MALYQILTWQEIPSQVKSWVDFDNIKIELTQKFAVKIDHAAQQRGLSQADDYLSQCGWSDEEEREGTAQEMAVIIKKDLEERFALGLQS